MLDPNNYRLDNGQETKQYTDSEVIDLQEKIENDLVKENIADLELSILKNGFLEVDKIVVRELRNIESNTRKYLVIEGNRRTSAFKSLMSEHYNIQSKTFSDLISQELIDKFNGINVVLVDGTEDEIKDYSQRVMGIRHISGPKKWGGYQSAKLIHDMSKTKDYKEIGRLLGIRHQDVKLRHEGFLALEQMKSYEEYGEYASPKLYTLFHEVVSSTTFFKKEWLGWSESKLEFMNVDNIQRVYDGFIPDKNGNKEINNPARLRKFSKWVTDFPEVREQLERPNPTNMDDVDFDFSAERRLRKINSFITFIDKLNREKVTDNEIEQLKVLTKSIQTLFIKEGM
ncbi:ParB N-terminal domain-containing protein [Vibrio campbellii]|nr:ParB N-terminal domain-containing protein [Vibrio sp. LB10LO1]